jgi:hypothetical protein
LPEYFYLVFRRYEVFKDRGNLSVPSTYKEVLDIAKGNELVKKLKAFWFVINKLKLSPSSMITNPKNYNHDKETDLLCDVL